AVNPKKQQLGGCLGQVKEGKEKEAKSILLERVGGGDDHVVARGSLLPNRRDDLHRVLESGRTRAAQDVRPQLDDAAQQDEIPTRVILSARKQQRLIRFEPLAKLGLLVSELRESGEQQRAIQHGDSLGGGGIDRQRGSEDEGAIRAGLDVSGALRPLCEGENPCRRRATSEIEPLARRDSIGARERN